MLETASYLGYQIDVGYDLVYHMRDKALEMSSEYFGIPIEILDGGAL